jgi:uncharacterized protein (DUF488 family)
MKLFTLGYEARTLPQLIRLLQGNGVRRLVDVRDRPISRRKGFSATALFEACRKVGITYEWQQQLGNPERIRSLWKEGRLAEGRRRYRRLLANGRRPAVELLVHQAAVETIAILCLEEDHNLCHRSVIAATATEIEPELTVHHL